MKCGLIERVHESVYRVAGSQHSWRQSLMAACFAEASTASRPSAPPRSFGISPEAPRFVRSPPRGTGVRVMTASSRTSRFLTDRDVTYIENIPVTPQRRC